MRLVPTFHPVLFAAACLCMASPAMGQTAPQNQSLPSLDAVEPLDRGGGNGGIHDVQIRVGGSYANAVNINQPTTRDQKSWVGSLGVSAALGDMMYAGITGTYSREDISSTNLAFAMPMAGLANVLGVDGVVGIRPVDFLAMGVSAGTGRADASYSFTGLGFVVPSTPADSSAARLGAFMTAFYQIDRLDLALKAEVLGSSTTITYGPGNIPASDSFGNTLLVVSLSAQYALTDKLSVTGGAGLVQVLSEKVPAAQTGLDPSWGLLEAGLDYQLTDQLSIGGRLTTWVFNDRMSFNRAAVSATYSF